MSVFVSRGPVRTPFTARPPASIQTKLSPRFARCCSTRACPALPIATTPITAAIPIVMPRTVSELRSLFLSNDLTDAPIKAVESTSLSCYRMKTAPVSVAEAGADRPASIRSRSRGVRYLSPRRVQLEGDSSSVRSRQRKAGVRKETPPLAASQRPGQMEDVGGTPGYAGDAAEGEPRASPRTPAHQVGKDGGLSLRLLSRRRAGHGARSRPVAGDRRARPDVRRCARAQSRRLRRAGRPPRLRHQRLRRNDARALGVGRQAPRGQPCSSRPRGGRWRSALYRSGRGARVLLSRGPEGIRRDVGAGSRALRDPPLPPRSREGDPGKGRARDAPAFAREAHGPSARGSPPVPETPALASASRTGQSEARHGLAEGVSRHRERRPAARPRRVSPRRRRLQGGRDRKRGDARLRRPCVRGWGGPSPVSPGQGGTALELRCRSSACGLPFPRGAPRRAGTTPDADRVRSVPRLDDFGGPPLPRASARRSQGLDRAYRAERPRVEGIRTGVRRGAREGARPHRRCRDPVWLLRRHQPPRSRNGKVRDRLCRPDRIRPRRFVEGDQDREDPGTKGNLTGSARVPGGPPCARREASRSGGEVGTSVS